MYCALKTTIFSRHGYTTDSTLLERMAAAEEKAWKEFDRKYRIMIYAVGQQRGLPLDECEDLMQEVMLVCSRRLESFSYDRKKGKFRSYLVAIIINLSRKLLRGKCPDAAFFPEYDDGIDALFMKEYEDFLLERFLGHLKERVSSETYSVFEMLCIQQMPVPEICRVTGKNRICVYLIRHRCMKILRSCIRKIPEAADRVHCMGISSKNP